ncbi:MAG: hypothetical protein GXO26_08635 [Crenarchaeota archaeon]|nr:hypothetical protein [Thermoproteota archaeon]
MTPNLDRWLESNAAKKEFKDWWTKYRAFSTDLVITRKISTFIAEELDLIRIIYGIKEIDEDVMNKIAESWIKLLERLGIDRFSIRRGEINGLRAEIVNILKKIFPLLEHYSAPAPFRGFRPREEIYSTTYSSSIRVKDIENRKVESKGTTSRVESMRPIYRKEESICTRSKVASARYRVLKIIIPIVVMIIISMLAMILLVSIYHIGTILLIGEEVLHTMKIVHKSIVDGLLVPVIEKFSFII